MATRDFDPAPLLTAGVAIGLHLELPGSGARGREGGETEAALDTAEREAALTALADQLALLEASIRRPAAHLDGHHHCHAAPVLATAIGREAARRGLPVRSVGPRHRRALRTAGAPTPDRLVGRLSETEPVLPSELEPLVARRGAAPPGITEWMVHPGYGDPAAGSSYDAGREEDLRLLLELAERDDLRALRTTHRSLPGSAGEHK